MVPIAKAGPLGDRSSVVGRWGRHEKGVGNGEDKRTLGGSYISLWKVWLVPKASWNTGKSPVIQEKSPLTNTSYIYPWNPRKSPMIWEKSPSYYHTKPVLGSPQITFLKHREIPSDLREIPILLSHQTCPRIATSASLKHWEIPTDLREIPRPKSFLKWSVEVLGFRCHERQSVIALGLVGLV